jgi:hypothetical protein
MDPIRRLFAGAYRTYDPEAMTEYYSKDVTTTKPQVLGNKFMSKRVYGFIRTRLHHHIEKDYIFDNTRVSLSIYCIDKRSRCLRELVRVLNFYIYTLNKVARLPVVNITLYLTNLKKTFPSKDGVVLGEDNVNSGVTVFDGDDRHIVIYRKEEIYKVLLHELIHAYQIDFHRYDPEVDAYFMKTFGIDVQAPAKNPRNPLALFESYTETLACYGYVLTHTLFANDGTIPAGILEDAMRKELRHSVLVAAKVLRYGGLKENSHVFSYYIAKTALLANLGAFLRFVDTHGIALVDQADHHAYLLLLKGVVEDELFWQRLKTMPTRKILLSSLKMTKLCW